MSEETRKILDMISNGTITQEEGEKLIEALYEKEEPRKNTGKKSTLRVRIDARGDGEGDKAVVNVNVPLILAKKMSGLTKLVPKSAKESLTDEGIDLDAIDLGELISMFEDGDIDEDLVTIDAGSEEKPVTVRVYVD